MFERIPRTRERRRHGQLRRDKFKLCQTLRTKETLRSSSDWIKRRTFKILADVVR